MSSPLVIVHRSAPPVPAAPNVIWPPPTLAHACQTSFLPAPPDSDRSRRDTEIALLTRIPIARPAFSALPALSLGSFVLPGTPESISRDAVTRHTLVKLQRRQPSGLHLKASICVKYQFVDSYFGTS